jgi:hypothetical protein
MKRYILPFLLLLLLFGCLGSKSHLSVSLSQISPAKPYEGDEVTFSVNVVNSGAAEAKEFTVDFLVNNVSVKTELMTLPPNSNKTTSFSWFPYSAGEYDVVAKTDASNLISDASADKETKVHLSVSSAEEVDIFSALPSGKLDNIGVINVSSQGISSVYTYSANMKELPDYFVLLKPYVKNLKEVRIGTVDYADSRHAIVIFIKGIVSIEQISNLLLLLTKTQFDVQHKTINGTDVSLLANSELSTPFCVWREKGWLKLTIYIDSVMLETCESMFGRYDPSYANEPLSSGAEFAKEPPFNATLLGATLHLSNLSNVSKAEYGAAFEDGEGFYGFYVTKEPYTARNNTCFGRILNRSSMQVCENPPPTNSTWTLAQRRVGDYSLVCLSSPKTGETTIEIETKALDLCYSLNFSGEERTWTRIFDMLRPRTCEFPDNFSCLSYDISNATLKLNLTQNTGKTAVLYGFRCSSEVNASSTSFQLPKPIILNSNSSLTLESPCYDEAGGIIQDYVYFSTKLYLNYSFEGSNEPKVIVGNLTLRKI